jgi:hypothetical protein
MTETPPVSERGQELAALRLEWGDWYYLGWQAGQFFAVRKDDSSVVRQPEVDGLRKELAADFAARPGLLG